MDYKEQLYDALESVVWYNGHYQWLEKLIHILESPQPSKNISCPDFCNKRNSEEHVIWMLLVGMFGEWGTSINSGWIEYSKRKEAAQFIKELCAESWKAEGMM